MLQRKSATHYLVLPIQSGACKEKIVPACSDQFFCLFLLSFLLSLSLFSLWLWTDLYSQSRYFWIFLPNNTKGEIPYILIVYQKIFLATETKQCFLWPLRDENDFKRYITFKMLHYLLIRVLIKDFTLKSWCILLFLFWTEYRC